MKTILLLAARRGEADEDRRRYDGRGPLRLTVRYMDKLRRQAMTGTTSLNAPVIHPTVAASWLFEHVNTKNTAGCQVADVVVSSLYNATNESGACPILDAPAKALRPVMGKRDNLVANAGLKLLPWDMNIPERFRPIYTYYGYRW